MHQPWLVGLILAACFGQVQPTFEVASVKPSNSADRRPLIQIKPGGRLTVSNFSVKSLMRTAYGVKDFQISGGPPWMSSDLFDIVAKAEETPKQGEMQLMIQALLADRFKLAIRRETREMPVFALVISKTGLKIHETKESDPDITAGGPPRPEGARGRASMINIRLGLMRAQEIDMKTLAGQLASFLGRQVLDQTGLAGKYDVKLEWQPDDNQVVMFRAMGVPEGFTLPALDPLGPSLFAALQEQLGLRLESQKGPVEILVIERIEKPTEN